MKRNKKKSQATYTIITTCEKLYLDAFLDCLCEGNFGVLGAAPQPLLAAAWKKIQEQYAELVNDASYLTIIHLGQEITAIEARLLIIEQCVSVLHDFYAEDLAAILREYGYQITYIEDIQKYRKQLSRILSRLKTDYVQLQIKIKDWEALQSKSTENKPERLTFEQNLLSLSKERGQHLTAQTVTVYQYALMVRQNNAAAALNNV